MDDLTQLPSRERAQQLYSKIVELRHRMPQAGIHADHNLWCQIRDNYESIVLEDLDFAEQHDAEVELWQLHYKRIAELRFQISALNMSASATGQNGKLGPARLDRLEKVCSLFKSFLSEATGFYHEFLANIREKYGLQQSCFPNDCENHLVVLTDESKSADLNRGLISCQRCLIYLGDLARYKGLYGDESKVRDFAAASNYYTQASSLWPSHGNAYHQIAILVSYSGDEYAAIYYYFRSLAVDIPFTTARDNLVLAFEKNRLNYTQLVAEFKASSAKLMNRRAPGKGRRRRGHRPPQKERKVDVSEIKEKASTLPEKLKAFSVKFVRLNGILFTRTSLETFADVLSLARNDFVELLSSGTEEEYNLGSGPAECGLFIIRLVAVLIFTVSQVIENRSYSDTLQRSVLLQHAYTAIFEFLGHIVERCMQLRDPLSSYLLPGLLAFVEWLACHPDIAVGKEAKKEYNSRSFFWTNCVLFFNKLLLSGLISLDEDKTCFFDMSRSEEGETTNRMALWEDFEMRGFLPLRPAQQILDFSRNLSFPNDRSKEKKMRVQRIIGAGKACANVVLIGQQSLCFNSKLKKFAICPKLQISVVDNGQELLAQENPEVRHVAEQLFIDGEDEEEVIVFKPLVVDKHTEAVDSVVTSKFPGSVVSETDLGGYIGSVHASLDPISMQNALNPIARKTSSLPNGTSQHVQPIYPPCASSWLLEEQASVVNGFNTLNLVDNELAVSLKPQRSVGSLQHTALSLPFPGNANLGRESVHPSHVPLNGHPSKPTSILPSGIEFETMSWMSKSNLMPFDRRTTVGRPMTQIGPPPGFTHMPPKNVDDLVDTPLMDDYSWLDGYKVPSSTKGDGFNMPTKLVGQTLDGISKSSSMAGLITFPFPGKHASDLQPSEDNYKTLQCSKLSEHVKLFQGQPPQQLLQTDNPQLPALPGQYQGQSLWEGRLFV